MVKKTVIFNSPLFAANSNGVWRLILSVAFMSALFSINNTATSSWPNILLTTESKTNDDVLVFHSKRNIIINIVIPLSQAKMSGVVPLTFFTSIVSGLASIRIFTIFLLSGNKNPKLNFMKNIRIPMTRTVLNCKMNG